LDLAGVLCTRIAEVSHLKMVQQNCRCLAQIFAMRRGFLNEPGSRQANAKAKARAALNARRQQESLQAGQTPEAEPNANPERERVAYVGFTFKEIVQLKEGARLDGGWAQRGLGHNDLPIVPDLNLGIVWTPGVLSDLNYQAFTLYQKRRPDAAAEVLPNLHIQTHRQNLAGVEAMGISIVSLSNPAGMPERQCIDHGCVRCAAGQGGYRFWWVGPWTPRLCLPWRGAGMQYDPDSRRTIARHAAWPLGIANPPPGYPSIYS
jgi:hypothetical protein